MTDNNIDQHQIKLPDYIFQDFQVRLRSMENSLPPRVQILEVSFEELKEDFTEMRDENREFREQSKQDMVALSTQIAEAMDRADQRHSEDMKEVTVKLGSMGKTMAFITGGYTAAVGLIGTLIVYGGEIGGFLVSVFGGS